MRPHEEDDREEYRGGRPEGPYREERAGPSDQGRGSGGPGRQSRYQSPPPRGPPPEGPPQGSQPGSSPTRLDQARQAQQPAPRREPPGTQPPPAQPPQGQPPQGQPPRGQPPRGQPPAQGSPGGNVGGQPAPPAGRGQPEQPPGQMQRADVEGQPEPGVQGPGAGAGGGPSAGQPGVQGAQGQPLQGRTSGLAPVGVEELLQTDVVTAEPDTPVVTVVAEMAEKDVGSVVIVEEDGPVGIVTDRAIALSLETTPDASEREVGELLPDEFVTGSTEMTAVDVLGRLSASGVRRLPIVDEDGELAGIVTLDDVLVLLSEELASAAEVIRTQSPRL